MDTRFSLRLNAQILHWCIGGRALDGVPQTVCTGGCALESGPRWMCFGGCALQGVRSLLPRSNAFSPAAHEFRFDFLNNACILLCRTHKYCGGALEAVLRIVCCKRCPLDGVLWRACLAVRALEVVPCREYPGGCFIESVARWVCLGV